MCPGLPHPITSFIQSLNHQERQGKTRIRGPRALSKYSKTIISSSTIQNWSIFRFCVDTCSWKKWNKKKRNTMTTFRERLAKCKLIMVASNEMLWKGKKIILFEMDDLCKGPSDSYFGCSSLIVVHAQLKLLFSQLFEESEANCHS